MDSVDRQCMLTQLATNNGCGLRLPIMDVDLYIYVDPGHQKDICSLSIPKGICRHRLQKYIYVDPGY